MTFLKPIEIKSINISRIDKQFTYHVPVIEQTDKARMLNSTMKEENLKSKDKLKGKFSHVFSINKHKCI